MCPVRVLNRAILDWLPLDTVEDEDDPHDPRSNASPADHPVHVGQEPRHLLHAAAELIDSKNPADGNCLHIKCDVYNHKKHKYMEI